VSALSLKPKTCFVVVFILGLLLRLLFLTEPRQIVFDEVYFADFSTHYCCDHVRFFDIHPPHAKLVIAGVAKLFGHEASVPFKTIGQDYDPRVSVFGLRLAPALFGALIPSLAFSLVLLLGGTLTGALVVALALCFDNALWVQSNVVSLDPMLVAMTLLSFIYALRLLKAPTPTSQLLQGLSAGIASGLAVGTKYTGIITIGFFILVLLIDLWKKREASRDSTTVLVRSTMAMVSVFLIGFGAIYVGGWILHFQLLTNPGPGDAFYIPTGNFWTDFIALQKKMFSANAGISTPHQYASLWYTWPIMKRPVFYWQGKNQYIYLLGNPVVWYGGLVIAAKSLMDLAKNIYKDVFCLKEPHVKGQLVALVLIASAIGPIAFVKRPLFIYHYFTTFVLLTIFCGLGLKKELNRYKVAAVVGSMAVGFILLIPLTTTVTWGDSIRQFLWSTIPSWR
jgi:dolichyl-phosphate-mannose-protein mannosyltransferase